MGIMWVEKYRPQTISQIVGQKEVAGSLEGLLQDVHQLPHLLFSGSPGVGKTTAAMCVARRVLGENLKSHILELNASDERGIDMVREKVKRFSRFAAIRDVPFKIIILDEADEMTSGAQTALRRIIEDAAAYCRFIIIANNVSKIIDPIQSRCAGFRFRAVSKDDAVSRLEYIAKTEGVDADDPALEFIYDYTQGDMRHAINLLQTCAALGSITMQTVQEAAGSGRTSDVERILGMALDGKFEAARMAAVEIIKVYGVSESDFMKYLSAAAFKLERINPSEIVRVIAKYDYRLVSGASPEIQISALIAEIGASR